MKTRILTGNSAYCIITTPSMCIDIKLLPGMSASNSLRRTAKEWREAAADHVRRAELAEAAATQVEEERAAKLAKALP